mgnify:FL=1
MKYPSDITRAQFKNIAPLLEGARKKTRPRKLDLYDVFNGLLYLIKSGCQWRMIPKEYPNWKSIHAYFRIWSEVPKGRDESILDQVLKKIGRERTYLSWQKALHQYGYR